jgi:hypothetical protein
MTRDEATAHALCREAEPVLRRMGVVTTAHFDAMIPLIAAALAGEREACARVVADWVNEFTPSCCGISVERTLGRVEDAIRTRGDP